MASQPHSLRIVPIALCMMLLSGLLAGVSMIGGCGGDAGANIEALNDPKGLPSNDEFRDRLDEVLEFTFDRRLNTSDHGAWQILHGALAYKREFLVEHNGEMKSAVDHVLEGGQMKGWDVQKGDKIYDEEGEVNQHGLRATLALGSKIGQGHSDQWFAVLSQCDLPPDQEIQVGTETPYSMEHILRQIMLDVHRNEQREFSWTLIGLSMYLNSDAEWEDRNKGKWSIERLVEIEAEHPVGNGACGGTHRLIGMTMALQQHVDRGGKVQRVWKTADERIKLAVENARKYQNEDGSFSSSYLIRPGRTPDLAQNLGTTGHVLEFLTLALSDEELKQPWVKRAVLNLCDLFEKTQNDPLECGALYHAAHGLVLYRERVFGKRTFGAADIAANEAEADDEALNNGGDGDEADRPGDPSAD